MKTAHYLILTIGVLCLIYYGVIIAYAGIGSSFAWFWLLGGMFCILLFMLMKHMIIRNIVLPRPVTYTIGGIFLAGICAFVIIESVIIYHANRKTDPDVDYLIVLGAQIRGTSITKSLYNRLKIAEAYLKENPETLVIVSGGQGPGEDMSEASAMKEFLIKNGIDEDRIILEDRSTNTMENILYSKKLIESDDARVAVVTNGFHIFRSTRIAKRQGLRNVQGLSAPSDRILLVSYYVREVLAVIKDFLFGNM